MEVRLTVFAAAAVYVVFGAVSFVQIQIILSQISETESAYQDTYYVAIHGHFLVNLGIAIAIFGAITWLQTKFGAMRYSALTEILFWVLHIALIGSSALRGVLVFILPKPRRIIDYPEFIETYILISSWFGFLAQAAILGLFCLLLLSITANWFVK